MAHSRVLVADADSTDATRDTVVSFRDRLRLEVVPGGMPSVGRNNGARLADTKYVLFLDADIELATDSLIRRAVEAAIRKDLHCVTTNIFCRGGSLTDKIFYAANDFFQYLSCLHRPYSTGMFMLFDLKQFHALGGFDERVLFAEDYRLSSQVKRSRFKIVRGGVYTTNRRFQKMGHLRIAWLFLWTALNFWNEDHFLRDHHYWVEGRKS
jgi:glycosyltransferase involved in cell wall biosynthesis